MNDYRIHFRTLLATVLIAASSAELSFGNVKLPAIFSDHMVLQQGIKVPIWGWAEPGEQVEVTLGDQSASTAAGGDGVWRLALENLKPGDALTLVVKGKNTLTINDVMIGELWLCSGQSNMEMPVMRARNAEQEIAAARFPQIRVFKVERQPSLTPQADCRGTWEVCSPETAGKFSATAYFFGRELHRELRTPVGLVVAAWSGSAIEAWTSLPAQQVRPEFKELLASWDKQDAEYNTSVADAETSEFRKNLVQWKADAKKAKADNTTLPRAPRKPIDPRRHHHHPAVLFNGMIAPVMPYAIRGVIWYQGESNAKTAQSSALYAVQLPLLINDWRSRWGQGDFPFGWVQLPLISAKTLHWARLRDSQSKATTLPNTGMAVTYDIGQQHALHPKNKQDFGHRLAHWARARVYGQKVAWAGPHYSKHTARESAIEIGFDHVDGGLSIQGEGPLKGFLIAGSDRRWHAAEAAIKGDRVLVSSGEVSEPVAVRYCWTNAPVGNLTNTDGLPASPFRTDDWDE